MMFKRGNVVILILVLMVAIAGYLNWAYQSDSGQMANAGTNGRGEKILGEVALVSSDNPVITDETIRAAKQARDIARSKAIETYQQIINNPSATSEGKEKAQSGLADLAKATEKEGIAEGLLRAKGAMESVVFVNDGSVTVVVKTQTPLDGAAAAKFQDVVVENCKVSPEKVKITEVK